MNPTWFVFLNGTVFGPVNAQEVEGRVATGEWSNAVIWWRGQIEWIPAQKWRAQLQTILQEVGRKNSPTTWFYKEEGTVVGPLPTEELVSRLRMMPQLDKIRVTKNGDIWSSVFEFAELSEPLRLNRRQFPRAPLTGQIAITRSDGTTSLGQADNIGIGGVGVNFPIDLRPGETVGLIIKSSEFFAPIHVKAQVRFKDGNGVTGLQFDRLNLETQSNIIDYVKQFTVHERVKKAA